MFKTTLILILVFYVLSLLQASFLPHFGVKGWAPLALMVVFLLALLEPKESQRAFWAALIGGFFLDVFSGQPIGFWISISAAMVFFIKLILKKYVQIPFLEDA